MEELFNCGNIIVTTSTLNYSGQSYPISTIVNVTTFKMPPEIKTFIINAIVGILGLIGIFSFRTGWVLIGLIAVGICGWNCYNIITGPQHYIVVIEFSNGEKLEFDYPKKEVAIALDSAISKALSLR